MRTATDLIKDLSKERRDKIEGLTDQLVAEELTLAELRKALELTQVKVAEELEINQHAVSKLEKRSDLLISTMSHYVEALGGKLRMIAEFPDRPPVSLTGFSDIDEADRR